MVEGFTVPYYRRASRAAIAAELQLKLAQWTLGLLVVLCRTVLPHSSATSFDDRYTFSQLVYPSISHCAMLCADANLTLFSGVEDR